MRFADADKIPNGAADMDGGIIPLATGASRFTSEVERFRKEMGADKIDVIAHSRGGINGRLALQGGTASRVAKFITLSSPHHGAQIRPIIPTLCQDYIGPENTQCRRSGEEMFEERMIETNYTRFCKKVNGQWQNCHATFHKPTGVQSYSFVGNIKLGSGAGSVFDVDELSATLPWNSNNYVLLPAPSPMPSRTSR